MVYWVDIQLAQRKGLKFYQTRCNAIILYDTLPACCISKVVWMESGEIKNEKVESTKDIEKGILVDHEDIMHSTRTVRPVRGLESTKLRVDAYKKWRRRSNENGETRRWARVHQGGGARHWLQSTRIVTCSCERSRTFPSSRACQKDRKSSSSRSTSSRLAAEYLLQPIQQQFEGDDPRIGQCRVIRVVRNCTKSAILKMPSLLELRNCPQHLRTILGWLRIQKKV